MVIIFIIREFGDLEVDPSCEYYVLTIMVLVVIKST